MNRTVRLLILSVVLGVIGGIVGSMIFDLAHAQEVGYGYQTPTPSQSAAVQLPVTGTSGLVKIMIIGAAVTVAGLLAMVGSMLIGSLHHRRATRDVE